MLDLDEFLAEIFAPDTSDAHLIWASRKRAHFASKRRAKRAEQLLDDRIRRKRARALANKAMPAPVPPAVQCTACRQLFASAYSLSTHCRRAHATTARVVVNRVACILCRYETNNLNRHTAKEHPEWHRDRVCVALAISRSYAKSAEREATQLPTAAE